VANELQQRQRRQESNNQPHLLGLQSIPYLAVDTMTQTTKQQTNKQQQTKATINHKGLQTTQTMANDGNNNQSWEYKNK